LVHNEKRGAASLKPSPDTYQLAKARMKSVGDACFSLLFAGGMSPFQAATGSGGHRVLSAGECGARTRHPFDPATIRYDEALHRQFWGGPLAGSYWALAGAPGSTAATPSGLMLKAKNINGSLPGFPHWCTRPYGS
jgi:hypothetical protein